MSDLLFNLSTEILISVYFSFQNFYLNFFFFSRVWLSGDILRPTIYFWNILVAFILQISTNSDHLWVCSYGLFLLGPVS